MRTCSDCGREVTEQEPCPDCGSLRQTVAVKATGAIRPQGSIASMGVKYGAQRPWSNHWYDVQQELRAVEAACQPGANRDNQSLKRSFETFFTVCFHFGDWLWEDQSTGLTKRQVENFIDSDPALRVCEGLANTKKHRTR